MPEVESGEAGGPGAVTPPGPLAFMGRTILANLFWSVAGVSASKLIRFFGVIYCIRQVGSHDWGRIASTYVAVTFLAFVVDQGLSTVPALHKPGDRALDRALLLRLLSFRTAMAALAILGVGAVHLFLEPLDGTLLLFSLALLPRALNIDWWFQRREMYQVPMALNALKAAFFGVGALLLVRPGVPAEWVVGIEIATESLGVAFGFVLYRRMGGSPLRGPDPGYAALLRLAMPLLLVGVLNTVHQSVDILFLKHMRGYEDVGRYDVGYKIGYFLFFLGATLIQIIRPKLVRMREVGDEARIGDVLVASARVLSLMAAAFLAVSLGFSAEIVRAVFHEDHELTRFVFAWAPLWVSTAFMTMLCADTLLALGRTGAYLRGAALCAAVNVAGNFVLISKFQAEGALFATVLAEAAFLCHAFWSLPVTLRMRLARPLATQAVVVATIAGGYLVLRGLGAEGWFTPAALVLATLAAATQDTFSRSAIAVLRSN